MDYSNLTAEDSKLRREVIQEQLEILEENRESIIYNAVQNIAISMIIPIFAKPLEEIGHKGSASVLQKPNNIFEFGGEVFGWCKVRMFNGKESSDWVNIKYLTKELECIPN